MKEARQPTFVFKDMAPDERLRELMLYIAQKSQFDAKFGATKLNKVLFYSDFVAFQQFGKPVTGAEYMRLPNGPAPRQLLPVRGDMTAKGDAVVQSIPLSNGRHQDRLVPLREPKLNEYFSAQEISLVDAVIDRLRDHSAEQVSELSHMRIWRIADDKEPIPYEAVFVSDLDADEADALKYRELSKAHGWDY